MLAVSAKGFWPTRAFGSHACRVCQVCRVCQTFLADMGAVAFCDIGWGERRGNGVAGDNVSRNSFLATEGGSCLETRSWSVAKRVAPAVCRDSGGDRRTASPFRNGIGKRGGDGKTSSPPRSPTPPGAMKGDLGEHGAADGRGRRDGVSGLGANPQGGSTASSEAGGDRERGSPLGWRRAAAISQNVDI